MVHVCGRPRRRPRSSSTTTAASSTASRSSATPPGWQPCSGAGSATCPEHSWLPGGRTTGRSCSCGMRSANGRSSMPPRPRALSSPRPSTAFWPRGSSPQRSTWRPSRGFSATPICPAATRSSPVCTSSCLGRGCGWPRRAWLPRCSGIRPRSLRSGRTRRRCGRNSDGGSRRRCFDGCRLRAPWPRRSQAASTPSSSSRSPVGSTPAW